MTSGFRSNGMDLDLVFELSDGSTDLGFNTGYTSVVNNAPVDLRYRYVPIPSGGTPGPQTGFLSNVNGVPTDLSELFKSAGIMPFYTLRSTFSTMQYASVYQDPAFWSEYTQSYPTPPSNIIYNELGGTFDTTFKPTYVNFVNQDLSVTNQNPIEMATVTCTNQIGGGTVWEEPETIVNIWEIYIPPNSNPKRLFKIGVCDYFDLLNYGPDNDPSSLPTSFWWSNDFEYRNSVIPYEYAEVIYCGQGFDTNDTTIGLVHVSARFSPSQNESSLWYFRDGLILPFNSKTIGTFDLRPVIYTVGYTPPPP